MITGRCGESTILSDLSEKMVFLFPSLNWEQNLRMI